MYVCKCCNHQTLPVPPEDAVAFICPVCYWENDVFTVDETEPSDENHGLSLKQGQENYRQYGICDPRLKEPRERTASEPAPITEDNPIIGGSHHGRKLILPETTENK